MELSRTDDDNAILWDVRSGLDEVRVYEEDGEEGEVWREPTMDEWDTPLILDPTGWSTLTIALHCNRWGREMHKAAHLRDEDWTLLNILSVVDEFYSTPITPTDVLPVAWQSDDSDDFETVVEMWKTGQTPTWGDMIGSASWYEGFQLLGPNLIQLSCGS